MKASRIPLAIIGAGWVVEKCYLPNLADGPFVVKSIYDADRRRARAIQERVPAAEIVGSISEACEGTRAALIASPNPLHVEQCLAALAAGQMVLCEKPVVMRPSDYDRIVERSTRRAFVLPAAVCRYREDVQRWLAECARSGSLKRLSLSWVRSRGIPGSRDSWHTRASGGWTGVLPDLGYHLVDLAVMALGGEVDRLQTERLMHRNSGVGGSAGWYAQAAQVALEVPDDFRAELRINGIPVSIRACWTSAQSGDATRLEFHGDRGSAVLSTLFGFSSEALEPIHFCEFKGTGGVAERFEFTRGPEMHVQAFGRMLEAFASVCESGLEPGEQVGLRSVAAIMEKLDQRSCSLEVAV